MTSPQPDALFPADLVVRTPRRIAPGALHLPGFLSLEQQRRLVRACRTWPLEPVTPRGATSRGLVRGLPDWLVELAREARHAAATGTGTEVAVEADPIPVLDWTPDTVLVGEFEPGTFLRMHRPMEGSGPLVLLSVGDSGELRFGNAAGPGRPYRDVLLESGDAVVVHGTARRNFLGITRIRPGTAPDWCGLLEGRIGLALTTGQEEP